MTVAGNLAFQSGALYLVESQPATSSFANVTGTATLNGGAVGAAFADRQLRGEAIHHPDRRRRRQRHFGSLVNTNLPSGFNASLSYDAHDVYLNLASELRDRCRRPQRQPAERRQRADQLLQHTGGIPLVFGALTPAGLTQLSGETATGSQQTTFDAMNQFMGVMTDPFIAGRGDGATRRGAAPFAEESDTPAPMPQTASRARRRTRRLCRDLSQGAAAGRSVHAALERLGGRLRRLADHRWQCGAGIEHHHAAASTASRSAPTIASRRTPSQALRSPAAAPISASTDSAPAVPTCSRPAPSCGTRSVPAYLTGALAYGWQDITTDRTVTIAGIDQLRAQLQRQRLLRPRRGRLSFCHAMDGRRRHHALRRRTIHHLRSARLCRTGDRRRQHLCAGLCRARASPTRAANSASHRQILRDDERASSPCAAAPPGRMISTPTATSPRPSRRCPAHPSSSTAPRRRMTRRSSPPPPK